MIPEAYLSICGTLYLARMPYIVHRTCGIAGAICSGGVIKQVNLCDIEWVVSGGGLPSTRWLKTLSYLRLDQPWPSRGYTFDQ